MSSIKKSPAISVPAENRNTRFERYRRYGCAQPSILMSAGGKADHSDPALTQLEEILRRAASEQLNEDGDNKRRSGNHYHNVPEDPRFGMYRIEQSPEKDEKREFDGPERGPKKKQKRKLVGQKGLRTGGHVLSRRSSCLQN